MKKLLLFICAAALLAGSCKKETSPPPPADTTGPYFIRFKADGVLREYNYQPSLTATYAATATQHIATASTFNTSDGSNFTIQLFDGKAIAPGTFSGYAFSGTHFFGAILSHRSSGVDYGTDGANPQVEVVLTDWTTTEAKGTFSGIVKHLSGTTTITITDGEFYVKRI